MELTNSIRKMVCGLDKAKNRREENVFMAEGSKCVLDMLPYFGVKFIIASPLWIDANAAVLDMSCAIAVSPRELQRMSRLSTASDVIAVFEIPEPDCSPVRANELVLALDSVQDPGNLGTIIRVADWFGIRRILCSESTVDAYNPKVVMATMGALSRVKVRYGGLCDMLSHYDGPIFGTFLDGDNLYSSSVSSSGVIVMGNEGKGISSEVSKYITQKITIPSYPPYAETSESLNVGMAAAIVVSEFRRRIM